MPSNAEAIEQKQSFLRENELFTELELSEELKPIGKLKEIDLSENEIWLLQCPKGVNVAEFESKKLKIPGRTNLKDSEAISVEFNNDKEQHAFAYYNRKGHYYLRLLPVRGTIVVREHLKAAGTVTSKRAAECCPPAKRVPLPSTIRVRHPLLGSQYSEKVTLDNSVKKRLQKADEDSTQILKESLNQKLLSSPKTTAIKSKVSDNKLDSLPIEINSDNEEVEFLGEEILKQKNKKSKRKHTKGLSEEIHNGEDAVIKKKKSNKSNKIDQTVAEDLQWLQNI